ncbi:hypothetical protein ACKLNR_010918 [Fusarium oxysporum f. sp. zingiberi]
MSDSQPRPQKSTQTLEDKVDSPNASSLPDLEEADFELSEDDSPFQENETRDAGESFQGNNDEDDVVTSDGLPPDGAGPADNTSADGIANLATSLTIEESLANLNVLLKGTLEMVITQNLQTGMTLHEILKVLLHQMPDTVLDTRAKIRVKLGEDNYKKLQNDSDCERSIKRLRDAGSPWHMVTDMRLLGNRTMLLTVANDVCDDNIRLEAGKLSAIIGLDPDCKVMPKRYSVEILNYYARANENPRSQKALWSLWNEVEITDAFTSSGTLILSMESREDAEKLWKGSGVILGKQKLPAKPIDLRGLNVWCRNCNKPSHLHHECKMATQCGKCAGSHHTSQCTTAGPYRCVNCPERHRSASTFCKNSEVVRMLKGCEEWRKAGPSWARAIQQPQLPDKALMSKLRAYRNTAAGRAFLDGFMSVPDPKQVGADRGSANAGATTATKPASKPATNGRKRKWDSRVFMSEEAPPNLMDVLQENQRQLDKAKRGSGPARRGRPRKGLESTNTLKSRRGN